MDDPVTAPEPETEEPSTSSERVHRNWTGYLLALACSVTVVDQLTKAWAVAVLTGREPVRVVGELVQLRLVRNPGAAFSFATDATWVFTVIATAVSLMIIVIARRCGSGWWAVALGLMLGGALGNLGDRLFRIPGVGRGHVVDFVALPNFPVFNVADSCLVISAVVIGWLGVRGIGMDGSRIDD